MEGEIIYLSLHCLHQNDFCIKMGSDESHFNVSVQSHKIVSTNHNLFEEKEPKRYRTEVLPLNYQSNALPLGQTGSHRRDPSHAELIPHVLAAVTRPLHTLYPVS